MSAAAKAKRMHTRPEASLSKLSPWRMCIIRCGTGTRDVIADTAIGSVGERMAASANATASGTARDQPMDEEAHANDGEEHQTQREFEDDGGVL